MENQNTVFTFNLCLFTFFLCLPRYLFGRLAAAKPFGEAGSIKNNKLCKTNPISEKLKWL